MEKAVNVRIGKAGTKGLGVFANKNIKKGRLIEVGEYLEITPSESNTFNDLEMYVYGIPRSRKVALGLGCLSMYNHSITPNSDFDVYPDEKKIRIKAVKDIKKNEEVVFNYGYDLFKKLKERGIK